MRVYRGDLYVYFDVHELAKLLLVVDGALQLAHLRVVLLDVLLRLLAPHHHLRLRLLPTRTHNSFWATLQTTLDIALSLQTTLDIALSLQNTLNIAFGLARKISNLVCKI